MAKTRLDIVSMALRHIGVLAVGEVPTDEDRDVADDALSLISAELTTTHGLTMPADLDVTDDALALPLSRLVAVEIGNTYGEPTEPRHRAVARIRAQLFPDDRPLAADYDKDGTVTEAEQIASDRASFY